MALSRNLSDTLAAVPANRFASTNEIRDRARMGNANGFSLTAINNRLTKLASLNLVTSTHLKGRLKAWSRVEPI
jgi:hypothetical protein